MITVKRILSFVLFMIIVASAGGVSASKVSLNFKYVGIHFYSDNSSVRLVINNTTSITIKFEKIYAGEYIGEQVFPQSWSGDIGNMQVNKEYGKSEEMGQYVHVSMSSSTILKNMMGFRQDYAANINIDFYVSNRSYSKHGMLVDNSTLRYDLRINTQCPANFIIIQEEILFGNGDMSAFMLQDHQWKEMKRTYSRLPLNATKKFGEIGFGQEKMDYRFMWSTDTINSLFYTYIDGNFTLFFAYENNGSIVDDPCIKTPVPIFTPQSSLSKEFAPVVNYFMEHAMSVGIGIALSLVLIAVPMAKRRRL